MFEAFVQQRKTHRLPWLSASVLGHSLLVAAAWWFMWDVDIVPTSESARVTFFQSMPPPPPPPPPAKRTPKPKEVRKPDLSQQPVVPTEVPQPKEPEPPEEEPDDPGQEGGVEGGVPGGVVGGQLGGQGTERPEFDGRMTPPKLLSGPPIEYTEKALEHDVEGLMLVRCILTVSGQVTGCQVRQSVRFMDNVVVAALEKRRYTPVTLLGSTIPIEVYINLRIRLKLPNKGRKMDTDTATIVEQQIAYYRARASEYDEWFLRQGRYDRGEAHRRLWFGEVAAVEAALADAGPSGDILELACGTGLWTQRLAARASRLMAVDASPEAIAINRTRVGNPAVEYVQADLFSWTPPGAFDFVFFGFWLSHVPAERFEDFWALVRTALRPSGKVFFVDSLAAPEATARDQQLEAGGTVARHLNDGRTFRIVKIFYQPENLAARLARLGWVTDLKTTGDFFIHGTAARS